MLKIIEIKQYDVVNGPGIRCSIWLSGCSNHCEGCWSPQTWNASKGNDFDLDKIISYITNKNIDGISILGGDPFYWLFQDNTKAKKELLSLFKACYNTKKPVWVWTGYNYEYLKEHFPEYLKYIDVIIDGKYDKTKRNLNLFWRGSENQRVIKLNH